MKAICPILVVISCLFYTSCKQANNDNDLIHIVSEDLNVPISCISPAHESDSILFAGLENGDIVRVNFRTGEKKVIPTIFDRRVYDIVQENDTTLWVGVRNNGLVKCLYKNNSIPNTTVYKISVEDYYNNEPTKNYATYDIEMDKDGTLFLGTSSGVYCLPKEEKNTADTLTTIYRPCGHKSYHFGVNQVKLCGNSIFCATDSGLVILCKDKKINAMKSLIMAKKISHLYFDEQDSVLYATTDLIRYKIDTKKSTNIIDSIVGKNLFAYITDKSPYKGKWEFTATQINYSSQNGKTPPFSLQERMNKDYRNYLHLGKDFLFFSQGKNLYYLTLRQNPKTKHVSAAHTFIDGNTRTCHFITNDNYLYESSKVGDSIHVEPLGTIGNFADGENIIQMCHSNKNCLWYITNQHLYKIDLKLSFLHKLPFLRKTMYEATKDSINDDFKSLYYDKKDTCLYVGSRYKLYRIHNPETKNRNIEPLDIENPPKDLYVMDINKYGDDIYIASLNHGLIKVTGYPLQERNNNDTIISIMSNEGSNENRKLTALPRGLIVVNQKKIMTTDKSKPISSLFYSDRGMQFIIGYKGIGIVGMKDTTDKKFELSLKDMSFNKAAIAYSIDSDIDKILVGSQTGLYYYFHKDGTLTSIPIPDKPFFSCIEWVILILVLLSGIWLVAFFYAQFRVKRFDKKLTKDDRKISDVVKIEDRELLLQGTEGLNKIKEDFKKVYFNKKIRKRFRPVRNIIIVNDLNKRLKDLETQIEGKQITRENVITWNKEFINTWKKRFEDHKKYLSNELKILVKLEDIKFGKEIDTITSSQTELGKLMDIFICQIQQCETEKAHLEEYKNKEVNDLKYKLKELNAVVSTCETEKIHTKDEIQTCIIKLKKHIKKYEYLLDEKEQQFIISEEIGCNNSLETELQNITNLYIEVTEKYIPEEIEKSLEKIENLVNEKGAYTDLKEALNKFINDNQKTPFVKLPFVYSGNTRGFVAILCCTKLKNKQIKQALSLDDFTSTYFKDILQAINKLKPEEKLHSLIDKLKKGIESRQTQQNNAQSAEN